MLGATRVSPRCNTTTDYHKPHRSFGGAVLRPPSIPRRSEYPELYALATIPRLGDLSHRQSFAYLFGNRRSAVSAVADLPRRHLSLYLVVTCPST